MTPEPTDKLDTIVTAVVSGPEDAVLDWRQIDWRAVEEQVRRLRQRIFAASKAGDLQRVRRLQRLMLRSHANTLLSVRRVTERNAGRLTAGVDGEVVLTPEAKAKLAERVRHNAEPFKAWPVRRVYIPKPGGKQRPLGILVILDRVHQARVANALEPEWEARFEPKSYGFRPGRGCQDAIRAVFEVTKGRDPKRPWVLDADLAGAFDRVQHDALMARVARLVHDKRLLKLIRRYLEAGVMEGGLVHATIEGTPQGSPLSPLLSNVMLDDLDWELERRGHRFVRYADDGRVYVHSRRAGERVMASITQYVEQRLKLRVNREKSVVARALRRPFLGFCLRPRMGEVRVLVDPKALRRAKDRLRALTSRRWGVSMKRRISEINRFTVGWTAYFRLADTPTPFEDLDEWLRRRLRQVRWKEWKRPRTRRRNLRALGISETNARQWACSRKGYWRIAGSKPLAVALSNDYWTDLGLQGFHDPYRRFRDAERTAGCGPARPVVWGAPG
jgi:RNA-directed DNA polymerase